MRLKILTQFYIPITFTPSLPSGVVISGPENIKAGYWLRICNYSVIILLKNIARVEIVIELSVENCTNIRAKVFNNYFNLLGILRK